MSLKTNRLVLIVAVFSTLPFFCVIASSQPKNMALRNQESWTDERIAKHPDGVLYFYDTYDVETGYLTNLYKIDPPLTIDRTHSGTDLTWDTTEQYYQAGKFIDMTLRHLIRTGSHSSWRDTIGTRAPGKWAFEMGKKYRNHQRPDWFALQADGLQKNEQRMLKALRAKFTQNKALGKKLEATYPKILVEDAGANDAYFGAGADGKGKNLLGRMLMHVREELRHNKELPFNPTTDSSLSSILKGTSKKEPDKDNQKPKNNSTTFHRTILFSGAVVLWLLMYKYLGNSQKTQKDDLSDAGITR